MWQRQAFHSIHQTDVLLNNQTNVMYLAFVTRGTEKREGGGIIILFIFPCCLVSSQKVKDKVTTRVTMEEDRSKKTPSDFLKSVLGRPVDVKLNNGVEYRGVLACLDGFMNIAMEQTQEYVNGQLKAQYGDCFIRGNNGALCLDAIVRMRRVIVYYAVADGLTASVAIAPLCLLAVLYISASK